MRPLSLSIEGFTAFRDRQEIDFEPLELFVITGPTGAGKTSILDAIAFALYGEVPRIGGTKGTSDVISLGTDRATVQFVFSIADRGRYRIVRRISRRANVAQSVVLERQEGEDWLPVSTGGVTETNRQIEAIVGLDFDGFTRAVILPQGEFHRFLKGEAKERRKVLFSLLGVSYFQRMGALARARQADLEAGVKKTEDLLATHYDQVTEARLAELRAAAETATAAQEAITGALAIATENFERASTTTARIAALDSAATELGGIAAELAESLESIRGAEAAHADATAALQRDAGALDAAEAAMSAAAGTLEETIAEAGTLEAIAALAAAADTLAQAAEQERAATATLHAATIAEADATAELDRLAAVRDRAAAALGDASTAEHAAIVAASEAARIAEELARASATAETREAELRSAETKLTDTEAQIGDLERVALSRRGELAAAVERWEAHRRLHTVAELAGGLGPGDPCPVCGVALAGAVAVDPDVGTSLETTRSAAELARSQAEQGDHALSTAEAAAVAARDRREECRQVAASALGKHESLSALLEAAETADEASVTGQSTAAALGEARAEREAEHELARQAAVAAEIALTERTGEVRNAQGRLTDIGERRDGATATLAGWFGAQIPSDTTARLAADRAQVVAATDALSKSRATRDDLARQRAAAADAVATADRRLGDVDLELTRATTRAAGFASQVAAAPATTDLGRPPAATDHRVESAQTLAEWCSEAVQLLTSVAHDATRDLVAANAAVLDNARAHGIEATEATKALTQLKQLQQEAVKSATAAEATVGECERNLGTRKQMEEGIAADRARIAVLSSLGRELQNDRFGDYIIDETLGLLCDRASGELKRISGGRYSLRPAKGEFQVIDHANADERRSVKTLSGGETFLASLALALALSRHVGELATEGFGAKLESVFIDEGFGTLDPATLDEVIDALERLRAEDLIVGVISHVPELALRIQSGLEVHHDSGRSRITMLGAE